MRAPLSKPVTEKVAQLFANDDRTEVMELLAAYGEQSHEREPERVRLAILKLSGGDEAEVRRLVEAARQDYRDVLWWADEA